MAVEPKVPRGPWSPRCVFASLALLLAGGCARAAGGSVAPQAQAWIDGDLVGAAVRDEADHLATLARGGAAERLYRLDRLLDLHDAARFAGDADAREVLWTALGGHPTGRGDEATRDAWLQLLQEALAIEELDGLDEEQRGMLGDVIQLLSVDLELPVVADDLSIRTLAYRNLALQGHRRVADNARWRLYDHVFGTLEGAIEAPPERRVEVAVHALYAVRDDVTTFIDDVAPHVRPPSPAPEQLWALLGEQRAPLDREVRWRGVVGAREVAERELRDTLMTVLPAPRDPSWPVPRLAAGTGRAESLAPILLVEDGSATIDAGRPQARGVATASDGDALATRCRTALTQDGRGILLLVAPPMLPSPQLHAVLDAVVRCRVARLELALREPRVPEGAGDVIVAAPLEFALRDDLGPGAQAIRGARVHVHLDGRGPRIAVDGRWLTVRPSGAELQALLDRVDRAYPREQVVAFTVGDDVLYQQLLDAVLALTGGPVRHYQAVGWLAEGGAPPGAGSAAEDRRLAVRAALYVDEPVAELEQAFPLREGDQKRLEELAKSLSRCLPELETALPRDRRIDVELTFEEGRLASVRPAKARRVPRARLDAVGTCVDDEAAGFRLREHRDRLAVTVRLGGGRR